jgi:hypothetical protein
MLTGEPEGLIGVISNVTVFVRLSSGSATLALAMMDEPLAYAWLGAGVSRMAV